MTLKIRKENKQSTFVIIIIIMRMKRKHFMTNILVHKWEFILHYFDHTPVYF